MMPTQPPRAPHAIRQTRVHFSSLLMERARHQAGNTTRWHLEVTETQAHQDLFTGNGTGDKPKILTDASTEAAIMTRRNCEPRTANRELRT